MVTTRGGTETPGAPTPTPRSSTRKTAGKRELEALETPTQAKRQRKAPAPRSSQKKAAAKSDAPTEELSQVSADDVAAVVAPSRESPDASSATEGKEDEAQTSHDAVFYTPAQRAGSVYETPATHRQPEGSPTPKVKEASVEPTSTVIKRGRGRPRKTPQKVSSPPQAEETPSRFNDEIPTSSYESSMAPIPSQEAPPSAQPEKAHMHFDDDEESVVTQISPTANKFHDVPTVTEPAAGSVQDSDEDNASDSDDEAPEVVTTAAASSKAQAAQADAERAQKAQQAKEEAKRKAREELIATQQAAKREREEKKAKKLAKKAAKEAKAVAAGPEEEEAAIKPRMEIDLSNGLLPASLLENIDDQRPPTPPPERRGATEEQFRKEKLNRHIKFLERTEKPAKDVKKGKLNVAVLAQQNKVLPPKVNRNTKNVREHWLKGRQVDKKNKKGLKPSARFGKMERRPHVNRGFLRNGDE
ncbi:U3-snoRNA-assoc multi-domain protein [Pyrenophora tritici-repentis]|nr:U3-snoRNA-assoc multi-domain protein [Pyrenophora tritici-repentis]